MTQNMLSVHDEGPDAVTAEMTPEVMKEVISAVDAFNAEVQAPGAWVFGLHRGGRRRPQSR